VRRAHKRLRAGTFDESITANIEMGVIGMNEASPSLSGLLTLIHNAYAKLALGAIVALGAVVLTTVPALGSEPVYFTSTTDEYPVKTTTTVTKMTILEDGEDSISCGKVEYSDELTEGSATLVITPSYKECEGDIEGTKASATVTPGSCKIELSKDQEGAEKEGEASDVTGDEAIGPSGCGPIKMEDSTSKCTFEASSQGPATGTTDTPEGESGLEITSKLSNASVTYTSGCEKTPCPKMALVHPTIWLIVDGVWKLYQEIVGLRISFWIHGKEVPVGQQFNPGEKTTVEIKNKYDHWPIFEYEMRNENANWKAYTIAGEPGTVGICYSVFYFPKGSCRFELEAPMGKPERDKLEIRGVFFFRGEIATEVV